MKNKSENVFRHLKIFFVIFCLAASPGILTAAKEAPPKAQPAVEAQDTNPVEEKTEAPASEAVPDSCVECHAEQVTSFGASKHGKKFSANSPASKASCETCHGDMAAHLAAGGGTENIVHRFAKKAGVSASERNATCLQCHSDGARVHWVGGKHEEKDLSCVDCHSAHSGHSKMLSKATVADTCLQCHTEKRGEFRKLSHHPVLEGKITCTDCHVPHGGGTGALISAATVNDKCFECHAEKRGPFMHEHPPVSESCLNCHKSHGSSHNKLLQASAPFLCQRCHSNSGHQANLMSNSGNPVTSTYNPGKSQSMRGTAAFDIQGTLQGQYRGCLNCHAMVHGSNHPAGLYFQR